MDVTMPQLGETVTEGTITRWFKQVGDAVAANEPLFEVSTDKVDSEVPAPQAGVLTEIVVPEGETVPVGARLAVIGGRPPNLISPPPGCRFAPRCPYAQERCHTEPPPLLEGDTPGHFYRCWYPVGTDAGREALERNLADHVPQAEAAVTGELSTELDGDLLTAVDGNGEEAG